MNSNLHAGFLHNYLIHGDLQALCLFRLFALFKNFWESYSATTELPKRTECPLI